MNDININNEPDLLDIIKVIMYRSSFALTLLSFVLLTFDVRDGQIALLFSIGCASLGLHLYYKNIRFIINLLAWLAVLTFTLDWFAISFTFIFVVLSMIAYKEYACFKVPYANFIPVSLAVLWMILINNWEVAIWFLTIPTFILFGIVTYHKVGMPIKDDIGDKTKYQI